MPADNPLNSNSNNLDDLTANDYHEGRSYEAVGFDPYAIAGHTFDECLFKACRFNNMSLIRTTFCTCEFVGCEVVISKIDNITLNGVRFRDSKIMGLNFAACNQFGFSPEFENCLIDSSVFYGNNLKKGKFVNCRIRNCDFMECDLRESDFSGSTFEKTNFQKCNLEKADFKTARSYEIDPFNNRIKKAQFTLPEAQSFLGFLGIDIE